MRQLRRLFAFLRPYSLQFFASVGLMAVVGAMDAFRVLLIGPVFDEVLKPATPTRHLTLIPKLPIIQRAVDLQQFVPKYFHNAWVVVAVALVTTTVLKGICDYLGTYLVNYAGFGMVTDLRNRLYSAILRRSVGFFSRHTTGTVVSTVINDVEKVQFAILCCGQKALQGQYAIGGRTGHQLSPDGYHRRHCHCTSALGRP